MKLLENKTLCVILMVVLIIGGTYLGGFKGLNGLYSDSTSVFFTGDRGDGICVANDLNQRASAAVNLVTIASNFPALQQECEAVSQAATQLQNALTSQDIAAASVSNQNLQSAFTSLYQVLADQALSDTQAQYREKLYATFRSCGETISHDSYNQYAQAYNDAVSSFPASLLAAVTPAPSQASVFY